MTPQRCPRRRTPKRFTRRTTPRRYPRRRIPSAARTGARRRSARFARIASRERSAASRFARCRSHPPSARPEAAFAASSRRVFEEGWSPSNTLARVAGRCDSTAWGCCGARPEGTGSDSEGPRALRPPQRGPRATACTPPPRPSQRRRRPRRSPPRRGYARPEGGHVGTASRPKARSIPCAEPEGGTGSAFPSAEAWPPPPRPWPRTTPPGGCRRDHCSPGRRRPRHGGSATNNDNTRTAAAAGEGGTAVALAWIRDASRRIPHPTLRSGKAAPTVTPPSEAEPPVIT